MEAVIQKRGLSANSLKLIAIIAMTIDHLAWAFLPLYSQSGQAVGVYPHIIGRMTFPIMCFFVAEGYRHTRSFPRYAGRLLLFAMVSYVPFIFFETGELPTADSALYLNVLFTLFLGLLALWLWDSVANKLAASIGVLLLAILSSPADWGFTGVLLVVILGANRNNFKRQAVGFFLLAVFNLFDLIKGALPNLATIDAAQLIGPAGAPALVKILLMNAYQLSILLALPLFYWYNGKRGKGGPVAKWGFYLYYPIHLTIIGFIKLWVGV